MKKAPKIMLIMQAVFMYVVALLFIMAAVLAFTSKNNEYDDLVKGLFIWKFIINFIPLNLAFVSIIIAFISIFKKGINPSKISMIIKLVLIPFYIINFVEWAILGIGSLNPFLFIIGFLAVAFGIFFTYVCMLGTSAYNIGYVFSLIRQKKIENKRLLITATVFQFFFGLDVLGSIMLYFLTKEKVVEIVDEN